MTRKLVRRRRMRARSVVSAAKPYVGGPPEIEGEQLGVFPNVRAASPVQDRLMRRHLTLISLIVTAAALAVAAPASAEVTVEGSGEPAFTNSTQNTQWFNWQVPSFADSYRLRYRYYRDNVLVHEVTHTTTTSGTGWANWSGVATLVEGSQYGICVQGEYSFPNDSLYFPDGPNSCSAGTMQGKRSYTTIDRTKPTTSIVAAGGAAVHEAAVDSALDRLPGRDRGPVPGDLAVRSAGRESLRRRVRGTRPRAACPAAPGGTRPSPATSTRRSCRTARSRSARSGPTPRCRTTRAAPIRRARPTRRTARTRSATRSCWTGRGRRWR